MRQPKKMWVVDYRLWHFNDVLGFHVNIYSKWYFTKLGAYCDKHIRKRSSYGGTAVLYKVDPN